ncbi:DUF6252 family protein [Tenacibaculum sp.]|uniref:DUF6252 family protein n=1 Tax=Tenacibaculum sp. TaxID=1906242 RepID=UPI003D136807
MKKVLGLIVVMLCMACSKDDKVEDSNSFKVDIDGVTFTSKQTIAQLVGGLTDAFSIVATSASGSGETVTLNINFASATDFTEGTFSLTGTNLSSIIYTSSSSATSSFIDTNTGQIVITSLDATGLVASGTFKGTAVDLQTGNTVELTNGTFTNIKYIKTTL